MHLNFSVQQASSKQVELSPHQPNVKGLNSKNDKYVEVVIILRRSYVHSLSFSVEVRGSTNKDTSNFENKQSSSEEKASMHFLLWGELEGVCQWVAEYIFIYLWHSKKKE